MNQFEFNEHRFRTQVDQALTAARTVLHNTKYPSFPEGQHSYEDKFASVQTVTNMALASQVLGLTQDKLLKLKEFAKDRSVTLRLKAEEKCTFDHKVEREVESPSLVTEVKILGAKVSQTEKIVTKVTDYFWIFEVDYVLFAYRGNDPNEKVDLIRRHGSVQLLTSNNVTPQPSTRGDDLKMNFSIDRAKLACHTPRRNPEIQDAIDFYSRFHIWCEEVKNFFRSHLFPIHPKHGAFSFSTMLNPSIFVPACILFLEGNRKQSPPGDTSGKKWQTITSLEDVPCGQDSPVIFGSDANALLAEELRGLKATAAALHHTFTNEEDIISHHEAFLVSVAIHCQAVCQQFYNSVEYIEELLRKQLIASIGREVSAVDFDQYMVFNNRRLYRKDYRLQPFSYSVRFEDRSVEGTISIEGTPTDGSGISQPLLTTVRSSKASQPMYFAINASTKVGFYGERHLHAWINQQFAGCVGTSKIGLIARARQFCTYLVMVGTIASADLFEPKFAAIVCNKDELTIPLNMETLPTPKEFADAIASMSPEQQRFAKAFRSMKLSSTLFGVVVIQIKPQLEKLMRLPYGCLIKELALTQRLLDLFIQYQIPSDLLSYDGPRNLRLLRKIQKVRENAQTIHEMIELTKQEELEKKNAERLMSLYSRQMAVRSERFEAGGKARTGGAAFFPSGDEPAAGAMDIEQEYDELPEKEQECESSVMKRDYEECEADDDWCGDSAGDCEEERKCEEEIVEIKPSVVSRRRRVSGPTEDKKKKKRMSQSPPARRSSLSFEEIARRELEKEYAVALQLDKEEDERNKQSGDPSTSLVGGQVAVEDYTTYPGLLDSKYEQIDTDSALRPTIISAGKLWSKRSQSSLLSPPTVTTLDTSKQEEERKAAFDLLDALSRSGSLMIDYASLHVVIAATHCFGESLMNTLVKDNINPIEKVERSGLIMATTIQGKPVGELVKASQLNRIQTYSPTLFLPASTD